MARGRHVAAARPPTRVATPALQLLPSGRSLAVGFGLLAAALTLYVGARGTSVFAVRSIDVTTEPSGHSRLVERSLASLDGMSLLEVNQREISRRLEGLPHVHLLGFDRSFPNGLRVHVSVERPVAVLRRADENWLVSGEGRVLRKLDVKLRRPLPVVWLPRSTDPEIGTIIRTDEPSRAVAALATIRKSAPSFSNRIWYVKSGDQGLTMVLRDDFELRLGTAIDLPLKVKVAREVLAAVQQSGAAASYVDVAVPERPVAGTTLNSQIEP